MEECKCLLLAFFVGSLLALKVHAKERTRPLTCSLCLRIPWESLLRPVHPVLARPLLATTS